MPIEIALRCVHAIQHKERFAAYVLIPLHPERPGPQRSMIIAWTWLTIKMMYRHAFAADHAHQAHVHTYTGALAAGQPVACMLSLLQLKRLLLRAACSVAMLAVNAIPSNWMGPAPVVRAHVG